MDNSINEWLQQFEIVQEIAQYEEIHTERLTDNLKNLALQRTGFVELDKKYVTDKCWYRQYQYMLLLKSESESDIQRLSNLDWLDELSDKLADANSSKDFPVLDGKEVYEVSCANALTYQEGEDGATSVYSLQIYFNIKGGLK
ncbi:MAG: hypothetical protein IKO78_02695 [Bacilli bacterium]|nr:hypothetical protein [Bacilli bacterium]